MMSYDELHAAHAALHREQLIKMLVWGALRGHHPELVCQTKEEAEIILAEVKRRVAEAQKK